MKDAQTLIAQSVYNAVQGMPNKPEGKPKEPYSVSTLKLVILTFTRMGDLFGSKASNRGFIIYNDEEKGIYSDALELWCRKLNDLVADDFKKGMEGLEKRAEDAYRMGEELWPPSYAEFRALCFPASNHDTLAHKPFDRSLAIEDQTAKEKRLELGRIEASRLLALFDQPEEQKQLTDSDIKDLQRLERLK